MSCSMLNNNFCFDENSKFSIMLLYFTGSAIYAVTSSTGLAAQKVKPDVYTQNNLSYWVYVFTMAVLYYN